MNDTITYKEFIGSVNFSEDDGFFYGKIEGINDLVTFEAESFELLKKSFEAAVDDYLEICIEEGKQVK